jgi:hypothetical protein
MAFTKYGLYKIWPLQNMTFTKYDLYKMPTMIHFFWKFFKQITSETNVLFI